MAEARDGVAQFEALLSGRGQELLAYLKQQIVNSDTALRLGTRLRTGYPAGLVADALAQHELRLKARGKFDRAMDMFFTRSGLEQSSAEIVARHRAGRYAARQPGGRPVLRDRRGPHRPGRRPPCTRGGP